MELRDTSSSVGEVQVGDRRLIIQNTPVRVLQIVNTGIGSGPTDKRLVFAQGCKLYHQLISQAVGEMEKTGAHALQELQIFPAHCSITELSISVNDVNEEDSFNLLVISNFTGKILQLRSNDWTIVKSSPEFQIGSNWIKSAVWTSVSGGIRSSEFVTLTAKNELISWGWNWSNQNLVRCGPGVEYKVPEIYTGKLYHMTEPSNYDNNNSLESVLVCSGTVFGAVHLWNVVNGAVNVICTLEDHQGPITCIQLNLKQSYLITTSDDRCGKLYRIIDKIKTGGAGDEFQQFRNISIHLHLELFGHTARVYQGLVATNDVNRRQFVISSSNDGTVCIWGRSATVQTQDNDKNDKDDGAMEILRRWSSNNGSPVRALAYDPELDLLYTGGDDGSVMKWGVGFQGGNGVHGGIGIDSGQDSQLKLPTDWSCPRIVALANPNLVLGASHSPELRSFSFGVEREGSQIVWKSSTDATEGCNYTVMVSSSCKNLVAIGCSTGLVVIGKLSLKNLRQPILEESSILQLSMNGTNSNILWISKNELIVSTRLGIYYVQLEEDTDGSIKILNTEEIPFRQSPFKSAAIPKITAAVQLPTDFSPDSLATSLDSMTCLVLGDEHGVLRIYTRSTNLQLNDNAKWNLKLELPKWHAKYGISSLRFWNGRIVSTGRDCYLKQFTISATEDPELRIEVEDLHTIRTPFEWIDSTYEFETGEHISDLLCAGFHETQFQLYSIKTRSILAEIECGGAHRSYDWMLEPYNTVNGGHDFLLTLAFIRSKQINYTRAQVYDWLHPVKSGLPNISKKINCGAILEFGHGNGSNSNCTYFACGGEDTLISIFVYKRPKLQDKRPQLEFIEDSCGHSSSVRAVKYAPAGDSTGFLFSGGGRSELIAWKVKLVGKECQIRYERLQLLTLETGGVGDGDFGSIKHEDRNDVRILDIQCHPVANSNANATAPTPNPDGNTNTGASILVFAACSDGSVHCLKFNDSVVKEGTKIKNRRPFQPYKVFLQQQSIFHAVTCLFLSRNLSISRNSPQQLDVYGLTTNGYIHCWRTETTEALQSQESNGSGQDFKQKPTTTTSPADWSLQLTSSPVTSVCVLPASENVQVEAIRIVIGCDDGTLHLYNLQTPTTDSSCATLLQRIPAGIHTSTVSAILIQEGCKIITASVDQVVAVWDLKCQDSSNANSLTCVSEFRTGVHDCQSLILANARGTQSNEIATGENQLICCGGDGIEVGEFPPSL